MSEKLVTENTKPYYFVSQNKQYLYERGIFIFTLNNTIAYTLSSSSVHRALTNHWKLSCAVFLTLAQLDHCVGGKNGD
jgi:hypothetical protein